MINIDEMRALEDKSEQLGVSKLQLMENAGRGIYKVIKEKFPDDEDTQGLASEYFDKKFDELVHDLAIGDGKRVDGRAFDQVRSLYAKAYAAEFSPILHGLGIFYRGETHVLSVLTLGGPDSATLVDGMEVRGTKRFSHHYNFPPFSAGETGRVGGFNLSHGGLGRLFGKLSAPGRKERHAHNESIDSDLLHRLISRGFSRNSVFHRLRP